MSENLINLGQHNQKNLNDCNEQGIPDRPVEKPAEQCGDYTEGGWLEEASNKKIGHGKSANSDPMQSGKIVNDVKSPNRQYLTRYSKALRGCDEAMQDLFRDIIVIDEDGKVHPVPIMWATQEKAVAFILQENVRKDNTLVVDRVKLPMLAIYSSGYEFDQSRWVYHRAVNYNPRKDGKPGHTINEKYERDTVFGMARPLPVNISYTLYAWTLYSEDIAQINEQIMTKFSPRAYISIRSVPWETDVRLDSIANNIDIEPGDGKLRVVKFQYTLTAESWLPLPIVRKKSVLKTKTSIFNNINEEDATSVINRVEESTEE